jgi:hypothetical protein
MMMDLFYHPAAGTWAGHELSVEDNCVVVTTKERTVKIPYSQAKSPAEVWHAEV